MNHCSILGRMVRDADLRSTNTGKAVASFTLAVDREAAGADGNKETDFIDCVIWDKQADLLANRVKKGQRIIVEGRIQTRTYEDKQGQKRKVVEIVCKRFDFIEKKEDAAPAQTSQGYSSQGYSNQGYQNNNEPSAMSMFGNPFDTEIPF